MVAELVSPPALLPSSGEGHYHLPSSEQALPHCPGQGQGQLSQVLQLVSSRLLYFLDTLGELSEYLVMLNVTDPHLTIIDVLFYISFVYTCDLSP